MRPAAQIVLSVVVAVLSMQVMPAGAAGWRTEMVDDEGGPVLQASIESGDGEVPSDLRLQCLGGGQTSVRYGFGSDLPDDAELPSDAPVDFTFSIDGKARRLTMQLEEMDGAFAAYLPKTDELFAGLGHGTQLSIDDPTGLYHVVVFSLAGSGQALRKLMDGCP